MLENNYFSTRKIVTLAILAGLGTPLMFIELAPIPIAPWLKFDLSDLVVFITIVIYGPIGAVIVAFIKSIIHFLVKGSDVGIPLPQFIAFVSSLAYSLPLYYMMVLVKKITNNNLKRNKKLTVIFSFIFIVVSLISLQYILIPIKENRLLWVLTYLGAIDVIVAIILVRIMLKKVVKDEYYLIRFLPVIVGTLSLTILLTILNYLWFTPWYLKLLDSPLPDNLLLFVAKVYAPFNFTKGTILSILFILASYRLDEVAKFITGEDKQYINLD